MVLAERLFINHENDNKGFHHSICWRNCSFANIITTLSSSHRRSRCQYDRQSLGNLFDYYHCGVNGNRNIKMGHSNLRSILKNHYN